MSLTRFHTLRTAVQSNAFPGSPAEVSAVEGNLQRSLAATGLFQDVEVGTTDDPDQLVIALCTFPPELSEDEVAERLEQLWQDRLRYPFWEAHATLVDRGRVELEAATRTSAGGHYVTLHVVAQRAGVPAQRSSA